MLQGNKYWNIPYEKEVLASLLSWVLLIFILMEHIASWVVTAHGT